MPYGLRVRVPSSAVTNYQYIGESSKGRTPDFDSVCPGSNPGSPELILRSGETVSRRAHNPKVGGSIPSSATKKDLTVGTSLIGRASDSESGGSRFES